MSNFGHAGRPGMRGGSAPSKMEPLGIRGGGTLPHTPGFITPGAASPIVYAGHVYMAGKADKQEHVVVWKGDKKIYEGQGESASFRIPNKHLYELNGASMVHNHPVGSSFSGSDLKLAQETSLASTEVVTDNFTYTLTPGEGRATFADVPDDLESIWEKIFKAMMRPGAGPSSSWGEEQSDAAMQKIAAQTGMKYTKRPR